MWVINRGCTSFYRTGTHIVRQLTTSASKGRNGYVGFGSFHVDHSVEDMINMTQTEFDECVPDNRSPLITDVDLVKEDFGQRARSRLFGINEGCTFLNHGAFGAPILHGLQAAEGWRKEAERQPLAFMDRVLLPELVRVTRMAATNVLDAQPRDVVLTSNATTAINAVLSSMRRHDILDQVLFLDCGYGADKAMARHYGGSIKHDNTQNSVVEVPILEGLTGANCEEATGGRSDEFTTSFNGYILGQVELALMANPGISLAVFDHITSNTALKLPIAELTSMCHSHGVKVLIDGAHTLGQVPNFSLDSVQTDPMSLPDFFVGNFHKWFLAPRGTGFLWCNPDTGLHGEPWANIITHPIVSHGTETGFHSSFTWVGNADYSPLLALRTVMEQVWTKNLTSEILSYSRNLCSQAAELLSDHWELDNCRHDGTFGAGHGFLTNPRSSLNFAGSMTLVQLPHARLELNSPDGKLLGTIDTRLSNTATSLEAKAVQDWLFAHNIEVPIKCLNGRLCVRISAHIYNDIEQYKRLATLVASAVR